MVQLSQVKMAWDEVAILDEDNSKKCFGRTQFAMCYFHLLRFG